MSEVLSFEVDIPRTAIDDLRKRLRHTRWPEAETVDDWSQGVPLSYVRDLCEYWASGYDWPSRQARLNRFSQYKTTIDGLGIHFLHVRSPRPDAVPLLLTHGWPGSVVEFLDVIGPLTDPAAHGADGSDAFHVVCPSLPGYGFSDRPVQTGWGVRRIAEAWATLMERLGYQRFGAQGGDWGAVVTTNLAQDVPDRLIGIHLNMVRTPIPEEPEETEEFTDAEREAAASITRYSQVDAGYARIQGTRPQTLGYALVDSPAGQCAWILEKFWSWADVDGDPVGCLGADRLLDNVMLYWLTASGASSGRLYWESFGDRRPGSITVPMGATIFPKEIFRPSRRWAERRFTDIRHWSEVSSGGHFAAFERPDIFVDEVRAFFRPLR